MFNFVKQDSKRKFIPVSEIDIDRIENKFGISFPAILKKYYLQNNGKYIHTVDIISEYNGQLTGVHDILPIINNSIEDGIKSGFSVECIKEDELNEPWNRVSSNLIPLAINEGGDLYYWDSNDGKVYISFNDDEDENGMEIPYYVCSSVDKMFRLMNEAYEKGR